MAKIAEGRRALTEVEELREENARLKAEVERLNRLVGPAPAKSTGRGNR